MASKLLSGNQKSFWAAWNNHFHTNSRNNATCISGLSNDRDIVQGFCNSFSQNSFDFAGNAALKVRFVAMYDKYVSSAAHNDFIEFSVQEVNNAILQLKREKAADAALLTAEHVIYANHILSELLCYLFNAYCRHGYTPNQFAFSIVVPVIKDRFIKSDVFENYRPISLVYIFSKVFE